MTMIGFVKPDSGGGVHLYLLPAIGSEVNYVLLNVVIVPAWKKGKGPRGKPRSVWWK